MVHECVSNMLQSESTEDYNPSPMGEVEKSLTTQSYLSRYGLQILINKIKILELKLIA